MVESSTPFRISVDSTEVFMANFNQRVRIPNLTAAQRDGLKDMAAGDVISNGNRLKHWDGARWREVVGFFPLTAATNAPPAGVQMPMVDSTARDAIPAGVRPEGSLVYNSTTHRLQHWDGSRFLEEVTTISGTERNYPQRTSGIPLTTLISSATAGQYRVSLTALTHTTDEHQPHHPAALDR